MSPNYDAVGNSPKTDDALSAHAAILPDTVGAEQLSVVSSLIVVVFLPDFLNKKIPMKF